VKILIYGINYSPELTGIGKYTGEMARWFASKDHDVRVVTAPPYYPDWSVQSGYSGNRYKTNMEEAVLVTRCPLFVPKQQSAIKRVLHLSSFAASSSVALFKHLFWKPDVVVQLAPTLFCCPSALIMCKLTGAKSVLHIQDFEIDALFGLGMASSGRLQSVAFSIESFFYRRFDRVSTISPSMVQKLASKGVEKKSTLLFPNWSETTRFMGASKSTDLLEQLGVSSEKKVLLYSGNIGEKQGLEDVMEAAETLTSNPNIIFLIVGEGASKKRLVAAAESKGLSNVVFAPLQPYDLLPTLLASADLHLVIQRRGAADAVLPSKLTNILAVGGNSVITADPDTSLGQLCRDYPNIATIVEPESVSSLIEGIRTALELPLNNSIASEYAKQNLDKEHILREFENTLESL